MNTWYMYYRGGNDIKAKTAPVTRSGGEINIPAGGDWTDHGIVIWPGGAGSWDVNLSGMLSPCTVVKKGDTFYLYYVGADGNRSFDGGPRHRALGVATSSNGLNFTKYGGNPILTFLPHNGEEEGIFSAGAFLDDNDEVVLYYSALDNAGVPETVNSDVRLAVSSNGLDFSDQGEVLSHDDSNVWCWGDELFPLGVFREGNTYYVYYTCHAWNLGIAWGPGRSNINANTQFVLNLGPRIIGGCDPMHLTLSKIALFICTDNSGEIRTASVTSPGSLSSSLGSYGLSGDHPDTVYLDAEEEEEQVMQPIFI